MVNRSWLSFNCCNSPRKWIPRLSCNPCTCVPAPRGAEVQAEVLSSSGGIPAANPSLVMLREEAAMQRESCLGFGSISEVVFNKILWLCEINAFGLKQFQEF